MTNLGPAAREHMAARSLPARPSISAICASTQETHCPKPASRADAFWAESWPRMDSQSVSAVQLRHPCGGAGFAIRGGLRTRTVCRRGFPPSHSRTAGRGLAPMSRTRPTPQTKGCKRASTSSHTPSSRRSADWRSAHSPLTRLGQPPHESSCGRRFQSAVKPHGPWSLRITIANGSNTAGLRREYPSAARKLAEIKWAPPIHENFTRDSNLGSRCSAGDGAWPRCVRTAMPNPALRLPAAVAAAGSSVRGRLARAA